MSTDRMKRKSESKAPVAGSRIRNGAALFNAFWLLLAAAGCGYQFSGRGEKLPADVRTVFVQPFVNRTRDIAVDREITSAIKTQFRRRGTLKIVDQLEEADAVLSGVVRSFDNRAVASNRHDEVLLYEMGIVVDVTLRRRVPDQVLWRIEDSRLTEVYSASRGAVVISSSEFKRGTLNPGDVREFTDIQLAEALGSAGRDRIVEKFARRIYEQVVEMF